MEYAALRSMNEDLSRARRLVVKIGSALLVDQEKWCRSAGLAECAC